MHSMNPQHPRKRLGVAASMGVATALTAAALWETEAGGFLGVFVCQSSSRFRKIPSLKK